MKKAIFIGTMGLFLAQLSFSAFGSELSPSTDFERGFYSVASVEVTGVDDQNFEIGSLGLSTLVDVPSGVPELDEAELVLDQIIRMGKKVWKVVEAGRPVVNVNTMLSHALPQGAAHWSQFSGWKNPVTRSYRMVCKNAYGMEVIQFEWRVQFTPGGGLDGKGQYLANVSIVPSSVYVAWGFTFNADAGMNLVTNAGSSANPLAAAELVLHWKASSVMSHYENTMSYYVRGDGQFKDLSGAR